MSDDKPLPGSRAGLPAGSPGEPIQSVPADAIPGGLPELPKDGLPPLPADGLPELPQDGQPFPGDIPFKEPPKMNARPYIGRALKLLKGHMGIVTVSFLVSLVMCLLPFVAAAALGPLLNLFKEAADGGDWSKVWGLTSSFRDTSPGSPTVSWFPPSFIRSWLDAQYTFTTIFIVWTVSIVFRNVLDIVRAWIDASLEQRLLSSLRQNVYDHIQSLSLDFFMGGQTGALMQRILSETGTVQRLLTQVLLTPIVDILVMVIVIGYLLSLSWKMTLVLFVLAPLTLLMFRYTSGKLQKGAMGINLSSRELGGELEETISGISDIQVFNAQRIRSDRFREASKRAAKSTASTTAWMGLSNSGAQIFISLTTAMVLFVAIVFGLNWGLTFSIAIVFMQMAPNLFTPVQRLVGSYTMYQSLVPGIVSTYELIDTKPSVVEKPGAKKLGEVHGDIKFENVVFGYSRAQTVLNNVNFEIKEGETIALVGGIGCGKSTILNLILRFIDPQGGRILIEGNDISDVTLNSLREQVSKLSQFPFFLKDTIRENVRLGRSTASDAEVEEACKLAHIHDVIVDPQRMPKGYDTVVDVQIPSGGQKRLIALARCLLRKPEVLLLDEPTENLDADQRNRLIQVIREYANERTCVVISHDLNFIAAVSDRIIVLDKGRVADQGTHEELVQREGLYKTLYGLKNVDPSLLRSRGGDKQGGGAPGTPIAGMSLPGGMGPGGMPGGMGPR